MRIHPSRLAGAPASWGVSDAPGWGHQVRPERVLREMHELGLRATELGPRSWLPAAPEALASLLAVRGVRLVAAEAAVYLDRAERRGAALAEIESLADVLANLGGDVLVVSADRPDGVEETDWPALAETLRRVGEAADERDLALAVRPRLGTVVADLAGVRRLLDATEAGLCLDSGQLLLCGVDPVLVAAEASGRVRHVRLGDVDAGLAAAVRAGQVAHAAAARAGLHRPLADCGLDVEGLVGHLEAAGYSGWYALAQERALAWEPPAGRGPLEDVRRSIVYLQTLEVSREVAS